ncbi:MAG: DISARM system phospholipase D-like protein DrmC [Acidobacteria bacterium]|nr:DISARM system phospholipase D-like protein DrmC [Acidobacteriota bacterium]
MPNENSLSIIAVEAGKLARSLPLPLLHTLINVIGDCDLKDWPASKIRVIQNIAHPSYRTLAANFLDCWQDQAGELSSQSVCAALLTATESEKAHREHQSIELVWTGPEVGVIPLRRTEQALLQVIESAAQTITIISYAIYNIDRVSTALVNAANRGVTSSVIIETPDRIEGQNTYNTLKALGPSVASQCNVYLWPMEKRQKDAGGRPGILHVKCAVADSRLMFLSSANLTEYAFTLNMELGLLITGGTLPEQVEKQFNRMIQMGVLVKI